MIVETAYPHTLQDADAANNNPEHNALISGCKASPDAQRHNLINLVQKLNKGVA